MRYDFPTIVREAIEEHLRGGDGLVRNRPSGHAGGVDVAAVILAAAAALASAAVVIGAFVWAARKDGERDRAVQARLGIRRRTRLGR